MIYTLYELNRILAICEFGAASPLVSSNPKEDKIRIEEILRSACARV
jgi:hypothetical protein